MMNFLGFLCLLSSAAATPIISKFDGSQPSDGESKISYIILEPADLSQLGNFPWNPEVIDKSDESRIFVIKGIGNKKFGHLNALKQQQTIGGNKYSIGDYTDNKLDEANKNVNGINFFDRPCNRYHANDIAAKINMVEPEVKINSNSEYTNKEENQKQEQSAFTNNEEVKTVLNIPAPPSIDISSKTVQNQKTLLSDKSGYKYEPEIYKLVKSNHVLKAGDASSDASIDISVQPSSSIKPLNYDEQEVPEDSNEKVQKEQEINEPTIVNQPNTNVVDKTAKESDSSEEDTKSIINIPAPPSIDSTISLPSGYSSLSALQNEEKILMEKIKNVKLHSSEAEPERIVDKSSYKVEVVNKKPTAVASVTEKPSVTQGTPPSIDVSGVHNSVQWSKIEQTPEEKPNIVSNESNLENYPETESNNKISQKSVTTEREIKPIVKLNIPAPPSLDNTITLPSGYSSLSDLQNQERLILQKVKSVRLHKQEVPGALVDNLSYQYHPEIYKPAKVNINPIFHAEDFKNVENFKEINPVVTVKAPAPPSFDSSVGHKPDQWLAETVLGKEASEVNSEDTSTEGNLKPAVILNIPPPPTIENSITLPSGYSSLEAIQSEERNILRRIKNVRMNTQRQPGRVIDSSRLPEDYKVEVVKKNPDVNVEEIKPVVTVDIPAPPTIESLSLFDRKQGEEENNARMQKKPVHVLHDNSEDSYPRTNRVEVNINVPVPNQKNLKPVFPLHIPSPPSIDDAIILPSGYPTLPAIRNEEIILLQKVNGRANHPQKQPVKIVEESDKFPPQTNRVEVVEKKPVANVEETSHTVKYNLPVPPSLGRSVVLPSGYLTHSKIKDIERWIIQKIKEQRQNQAVNVSEQKVVVPDRNVWFKPAIKTNIPPPPSIEGVSEYSEYPKQQKVKLPHIHISGPVIRWNTPAPPTVNKSV